MVSDGQSFGWSWWVGVGSVLAGSVLVGFLLACLHIGTYGIHSASHGVWGHQLMDSRFACHVYHVALFCFFRVGVG